MSHKYGSVKIDTRKRRGEVMVNNGIACNSTHT